MFGNADLHQVLRYQADLRRDAAQERAVARMSASKQPSTKVQPRRILGLRLSLAS
jgi:hypothetical protein